MAFKFVSGNLLNDEAQALVNTVNCVGVMGKGIALSFKRAYPENYKAYKAYCLKRLLKPGDLFVFESQKTLVPSTTKIIVNFATKDHWRSPSKFEWIQQGLLELRELIISRNISSIAIPPLGCGNGGLNWEDILPLITNTLGKVSDNCSINIYGQNILSALNDGDPEHGNKQIELTDGRALLLLAIGQLEEYFGGSITRLSAHKIFYFAQQLYGNLGVRFEIGNYGPVSNDLDKGLRALNKVGAISGFYSNDATISVSRPAFAQACEYADKDPKLAKTVERLSRLVDGFESPLGMELLGTTHFIHYDSGYVDVENINTRLANLSGIQRNEFDKQDVEVAVRRLSEDGLLY